MLREEVRSLKKQGLSGYKIGQRIGVYYITKHNTDALDLLEEILTEEFDDYGN